MSPGRILTFRKSVIIGATLIFSAISAVLLTPSLVEVSSPPDLESTVPKRIGNWIEQKSPFMQVQLSAGGDLDFNQPYDQVVMRTYVNGHGERIMLALAWGKRQRQEVKIHRPDLCYVAQGYQIHKLRSQEFKGIRGAGGDIIGKRMEASNGPTREIVSYWMRIGNLYSEDAIDTRLHIFKEGLRGKVLDGILVRASMITDGSKTADTVHTEIENFLSQLVAAVPSQTKMLLIR